MLRFGVQLAAVFLVTAGCSGRPSPVALSSDLKLYPPFDLVELLRWRDGGSLGFTVVDARGQRLSFSLDKRIGSSTPGRWYIGATYPTHEGAELVASAGKREHALVRILDLWLSQHFTDSERSTLAAMGWSDELGRDRLRFDAWTILHGVPAFRGRSS